jgi:hypothetical protein
MTKCVSWRAYQGLAAQRKPPAGLMRALAKVGASYLPPTVSTPPLLAEAGTELFDIVVHMHGLESFEKEAGEAVRMRIDRVELPVLPLARIIASKQATGRPKDLSILPALEDTLRASRRAAGSPER